MSDLRDIPADPAARAKLFADIIEHLRGSGQSVHDAEQAFGVEGLEDSAEFCAALDDDELFLCDGCGWWCEVSEEAEGDGTERNCEDCA